MPDEEKENAMPGLEIINLLGDTPDIIKISDKEEYRLYRPSLGKLDLLSKYDKQVKDFFETFKAIESPNDLEASKKYKQLVSDIIDIFHILTSPNDGKPPEPISDKDKETLKWKLQPSHIFQILTFIQTSNLPEHMLKKVQSLKEKDQIGETS